MSSSDNEKYRNMVHAFRMSELQTLMVFAGRSKTGKKVDLLERAERLVKLNSPDINLKIKELSAAMYKSLGTSSSGSTYSSSTSRVGVSYSNPYTDTIPTEMPASSTPTSHQLVYPTYPDVSLKKLPFYKIEETLLKPCSLQPTGNARFQEQNFTFYLTPTQANDISNSSYRNSQGKPEYRQQIQMRFSLLETSCEQEDNFPSSICVKVNGKLCPLPNPIPTNKPNTEPKRPPKPINITPLCKLSATTPNYINVSWAVEVGRAHTVSVYQVDNLTYKDLLAQLKAKGQRQPDYTKALIKEKLADQDQEIATTSCKVTLACPLGKMRMSTPCRASTCDHLQCFDAQLYLSMNEKKPKWMCPVCNKPALMENLLVDGFFSELISSPRLPPDEHEIVLHNDGSWDPLPPKIPDHLKVDNTPKQKPKPSPSSSKGTSSNSRVTTTLSLDSEDDVDCITLDSDSEDCSSPVPPQPKKARLLEAVSPALTLSSTTNSPASHNPSPGSSPVLICIDD
jgi:hypothetical protein